MGALYEPFQGDGRLPKPSSTSVIVGKGYDWRKEGTSAKSFTMFCFYQHPGQKPLFCFYQTNSGQNPLLHNIYVSMEPSTLGAWAPEAPGLHSLARRRAGPRGEPQGKRRRGRGTRPLQAAWSSQKRDSCPPPPKERPTPMATEGGFNGWIIGGPSHGGMFAIPLPGFVAAPFAPLNTPKSTKKHWNISGI